MCGDASGTLERCPRPLRAPKKSTTAVRTDFNLVTGLGMGRCEPDRVRRDHPYNQMGPENGLGGFGARLGG